MKVRLTTSVIPAPEMIVKGARPVQASIDIDKKDVGRTVQELVDACRIHEKEGDAGIDVFDAGGCFVISVQKIFTPLNG